MTDDDPYKVETIRRDQRSREPAPDKGAVRARHIDAYHPHAFAAAQSAEEGPQIGITPPGVTSKTPRFFRSRNVVAKRCRRCSECIVDAEDDGAVQAEPILRLALRELGIDGADRRRSQFAAVRQRRKMKRTLLLDSAFVSDLDAELVRRESGPALALFRRMRSAAIYVSVITVEEL